MEAGQAARDPILIRSATEADVGAICEIYNYEVRHTTAIWSDSETLPAERFAVIQGRITRGFPFLVAQTSGGKVVGYASFGDFRPFDGYVKTVEHSVYVANDYHRRGVASALMEALIFAAHACGKHVMVGAISADNEPSLRFHESCGFVEVGRMHQVGRKFGRWLDLVLMQKVISFG